MSETEHTIRLDNNENEFNDNLIICPHCGEIHYNHEEEPTIWQDVEDIHCENCGETFSVSVTISVSFTTYIAKKN